MCFPEISVANKTGAIYNICIRTSATYGANVCARRHRMWSCQRWAFDTSTFCYMANIIALFQDNAINIRAETVSEIELTLILRAMSVTMVVAMVQTRQTVLRNGKI